MRLVPLATLLLVAACHKGTTTTDMMRPTDMTQTLPVGESPFIFGIHQPGGEQLMASAGKRGWITFSEKTTPPANGDGPDYTKWSSQGYGVIVRLNHGFADQTPDGTLPCSSDYAAFAMNVADWVRSSSGAHIWIIANEPNITSEYPTCNGTPEPITPALYASAFLMARAAIKALPGHGGDQVVVADVSPWGSDASNTGVAYLQSMLQLIGENNADGVAVHAYTRDGLAASVTSEELEPVTMLHHHFRIYRDVLAALPAWARTLPLYLTETNPLPSGWTGADTSWVQTMYQEIDDWNATGGNQIFRAVTIHRWPAYDAIFGIANFPLVQTDFKAALTHDYRWTKLPPF